MSLIVFSTLLSSVQYFFFIFKLNFNIFIVLNFNNAACDLKRNSNIDSINAMQMHNEYEVIINYKLNADYRIIIYIRFVYFQSRHMYSTIAKLHSKCLRRTANPDWKTSKHMMRPNHFRFSALRTIQMRMYQSTANQPTESKVGAFERTTLRKCIHNAIFSIIIFFYCSKSREGVIVPRPNKPRIGQIP